MRVGIALGSNIGDRLKALEGAREAILSLHGVSTPALCSSVYETDPVDSAPDSECFFNAVMEVEFEGDPSLLLKALQELEAEMGRPFQRPRNAPRVIDLDILYAGDLKISLPHLLIPHPRLHLRRFVLEPLAEIRPSLVLPDQPHNVQDTLAKLSDPAGVRFAKSQWKPL